MYNYRRPKNNIFSVLEAYITNEINIHQFGGNYRRGKNVYELMFIVLILV